MCLPILLLLGAQLKSSKRSRRSRLMDKIPLVDLQAQYRSIKKEIDAAIQHILDTNQFIGGAPLTDFERNFATFCGKPYAVGTSSGTSALYTALKVLGVGKGDEV